jgi:hypothetical protein
MGRCISVFFRQNVWFWSNLSFLLDLISLIKTTLRIHTDDLIQFDSESRFKFIPVLSRYITASN